MGISLHVVDLMHVDQAVVVELSFVSLENKCDKPCNSTEVEGGVPLVIAPDVLDVASIIGGD